MRLSSKTTLKHTRKENIFIVAVFVLAVGLRIISTRGGLGPYMFCDEGMWVDELLRMNSEGTFLMREFRSGALNVLPLRLLAELIPPLQAVTANGTLQLGRFFMTSLVGATTAPLVYLTIREVHRSKYVALFGSLLTVFSPAMFVLGQFWYPDHYLSSSIAAILYITFRFRRTKRIRDALLLGVCIGCALSIKTSSISVAAWSFLVIAVSQDGGSRLSAQGCLVEVKNRIRELLAVSLSALLSLLLLNFSLFINFDLWQEAMKYNSTNYQGSFGFKGIVMHLLLGAATPVGVAGIVGIVFYGTHGFRNRFLIVPNFLILSLLAIPIVNSFIFGLSGHIIYRNISSGLVPTVIVATIGLSHLLQIFHSRNKGFGLSIGIVLLLPIMLEISTFVLTKLADDSREIAQNAIPSLISKDEVIGTNEFCSGDSPALVAGYETVYDPHLSAGIDVFLINSYWSSPLSELYTESGFLLDAHFYWFDVVDFRIFNRVKPSREDLEDRLPHNFDVLEIFRGSGPDMILVKRTR